MAILDDNKAFPIPSPVNGSTRLPASPTSKHPLPNILRNFNSFFLGEPKGNCHPFPLSLTSSAFANLSLNFSFMMYSCNFFNFNSLSL